MELIEIAVYRVHVVCEMLGLPFWFSDRLPYRGLLRCRSVGSATAGAEIRRGVWRCLGEFEILFFLVDIPEVSGI